jgi:hypothetical protein
MRETGRLQFFFHSPSSELPIRDVLDEQHHGCKTEPYIEKCAENYCSPCDPQNVLGFLRSEEKYLFLFTTFRNRKYENKRFIVGYIKKRSALLRRKHGIEWWCVQGPTKIVSFDHAYALDRSVAGPYYRTIRRRKLDECQTAKVLAKIEKGPNILSRCIAEIERLSQHIDVA